MKTKELITDIYHRLGLSLINLLARSNRYERAADISYGDNYRNRLDYYTQAGDKARPTIIFYYGGNWRSGAKEDYRFVADTLIELGFNVVIPDYRLYPNVRFEQIQDDAVSAARWAMEHIPPDQPIYILGHSAGAQLGALICLNQALLGEEGKHRIKAFVGLAGPYDFYPFTEDDHWDLFAPAHKYPDSQAVNYVHGDAVPMYLLHGEADTRVRRGHSKSLMEKLQEVGAFAAREVYSGMGHVDIVLQFTRVHRGKSKVIEDIKQFLTRITEPDFNPNN